MSHIIDTHDGTSVGVFDKVITFLTTDSTLHADGDQWTKIGELSGAIAHPTESHITVSKGAYLKGNTGEGNAPVLFFYAVSYPDKAVEAICFTSMLGHDASLNDTWWLQPGASKHYAVCAIPTSGGPMELMANGRRIHGYFNDNLNRMCPFYAGWIIPYVDTQANTWEHPTACLGSDKNINHASMSSNDSTYSVGLTLMGQHEDSLDGDGQNLGAFLMMQDGRFEKIQGSTNTDNIYSPLTEATPSSVHGFNRNHTKANLVSTYNKKTLLIPEVLILPALSGANAILLGELDGIVSIGHIGLVGGATIHDASGLEWITIKQRNITSHAVDGFAMRRV